MKKVAIITGVASGIGLASARIFLNNDYCVVGMSRRSAMAEDLGADFTYVAGDVSVSEDRANLVNIADGFHGNTSIYIL